MRARKLSSRSWGRPGGTPEPSRYPRPTLDEDNRFAADSLAGAEMPCLGRDAKALPTGEKGHPREMATAR